MKRILILFLLASAGCLESVVSGTCADGYVLCEGECVAGTSCVAPDAGPGQPDAAPGQPDAAPGQQPDAAPTPGADAGPSCPTDEAMCSGTCVDLGNDDAHCGSCDNVCGAGTVCMSGACCAPGQLACRGQCIDPMTDPDNCGSCGVSCASGLCTIGVCEGGPIGHVVLVGHDYVRQRAGMNRLVGNAVFLARAPSPRVLVYEGTAQTAALAGTNAAIDQVAVELGRTWRRSSAATAYVPGALANVDAFVVAPQYGSADADLDALGVAWADALSAFLDRGGVIVVLEGAGGQTHRILSAADLTPSSDRSDATGTVVSVAMPNDAVVAAVPAKYFAEPTSVAFTTMDGPAIVVDAAGHAIALHWVLR